MRLAVACIAISKLRVSIERSVEGHKQTRRMIKTEPFSVNGNEAAISSDLKAKLLVLERPFYRTDLWPGPPERSWCHSMAQSLNLASYRCFVIQKSAKVIQLPRLGVRMCSCRESAVRDAKPRDEQWEAVKATLPSGVD